jgi:prevent-host-death family protein
MTKMPVSKVRNDFSEIINIVSYRGDRVVLQRRGKDVAAVVPLEDLELLEALEDKLDIDAARKALKEAGKKGTVSWTKIKEELGI